jgi:hypothetical protein
VSGRACPGNRADVYWLGQRLPNDRIAGGARFVEATDGSRVRRGTRHFWIEFGLGEDLGDRVGEGI